MILVKLRQTVYADALLVIKTEEVQLLAVETAVDWDGNGLLLVTHHLKDRRNVVVY